MKTINQKTRLILFVTSCIVLICICLTYFAIYSMKKNAENIFNQQGFSIIEKSKSYIDGDEFESFSKNYYDLNDFYYKTYNNLFTLKNNSDCSYIYTLTPYQNTNFKYVIDASDVLTSEDLETPGTIVDVSEDYEIIQNCIKEKKVLMCAIPTKQYFEVKSIIQKIDENVFFLITDTYEIYGGDVMRLSAQIISGLGFLGSGLISFCFFSNL